MRTLTAVLSAALLGISTAQEEIRPPLGDPGLRAILGVSSIFARTTPPEGTISYICAFAKFEDGKFKGYGGHLDSPLADSPFFAELLWADTDDSTGWAMATASSRSGGRTADPFFNHIKTSGWRAYELRKVGTFDEPLLYEGYRILGVASDGANNSLSLPEADFPAYLNNCKFAVVLLVKFFSNQEDHRKALSKLNSEDK